MISQLLSEIDNAHTIFKYAFIFLILFIFSATMYLLGILECYLKEIKMIQLFLTHLNRRRDTIAAAHHTTAENVRIVYENNAFYYEILKDGKVIISREFKP